MKKFFVFLLIVVGSILPCQVVASDFTVDGISYNITSAEEHTVAVTRGTDKYVGSVVIPESVAYDGETYSVTAIGNWAFGGCYGLTFITIPNSVTAIGNNAFDGCRGLTSITIPKSVTTISYEAFFACSGLECIVVDAGNPVYDSRDNCNAIIETSSNTVICGCKNTIIPNSVTIIGELAFCRCDGLTSIVIPNSVTTIGESAFSGCSGLTSITIPNSVTTIGYRVFLLCSGLTSITIPNSVTTIGGSAFSLCSGLTSIVIPNSVTTIGNDAFGGCSGLTSIVIPNSVTTIGNSAFSGCSSLTSITIPNSMTTIGDRAFSWCNSLKDFYCHAESVPTTGNNIFSNVDLSSTMLHVPEASIQEYASEDPWNEFGQIVALGESDGIERLASETNRPATVYDLNGRRVANPRKGIYVIGGRKTVVR